MTTSLVYLDRHSLELRFIAEEISFCSIIPCFDKSYAFEYYKGFEFIRGIRFLLNSHELIYVFSIISTTMFCEILSKLSRIISLIL